MQKNKLLNSTTKNYPYPISKLWLVIEEEKNLSSKFFYVADFFNAIINYIHYIVCNDLPKANQIQFFEKSTSEKIKDLKKLITKTDSNIFNLKKEELELIENLNKELKKLIKSNFIENREYKKFFLKKEFNETFNIISKLDIFNNYELIVPYQIKKTKKEIKYISLNGSKPKFLKINFEKDDLYINNIYLKSRKNKNQLLEVKTNNFFGFIDNKNYGFNKKFQEEINEFNYFITKSKRFEVTFYFEENSEKELKFRDKIFERPNEFQHIDNFFESNESGFLFIVGPTGIGKSTLISMYKDFIKQNPNNTRGELPPIINKNSVIKYNNFKDDKIFYKLNILEKEVKILSFAPILKNINKVNNESFKLKNDSDFIEILKYLSKKETKQVLIIENIHLLENFSVLESFFSKELPKNVYIIFTMSSREIYSIPELKNKEIYYLPHFSKVEIANFYQRIYSGLPKITEKVILDISNKSYGIPIYIKYLIIKEYKEDYIQASLIKNKLLKKFKATLFEIEQLILKYDISLKEYSKYFFALLTIGKEGFNKKEIKEVLFYLPENIVDTILDKSGDFILKINNRYNLISSIYEEYIIEELDKEKIKFLHNRIIDFFEPWDKKISSLSLKYLPYHYLEANRIGELKLLLQTNFIKSKFKLYPNETLNDLKNLIKELSKTDNRFDVIKFLFIFQSLKEESKKESLKIESLITLKTSKAVIERVGLINKPNERFLQLLISSLIFMENKNTIEGKNLIKEILEIPEPFINKDNKEIIFRLACEILLNDGIDIVNLPKSKEDGIILIKYIKENANSGKLIDVFIKLTEIILSEIDKVFIIDALINRVSKFSNSIIIEGFFSKVLNLIDKLNDSSFKDRLYYTYIKAFSTHIFLYEKFFDKLISKKDKIQNNFFKFAYYINLSIIFLELKQEKISFDYIEYSINNILDHNNEGQINVSATYLIKHLIPLEKSSFYIEIISSLGLLIDKIQNTKNKIENIIFLIEILETHKKQQIEFIKKASLILEKLDTFNFIYFSKTLSFILKIEDKRIKNPLVKKIKTLLEKNDKTELLCFIDLLIKLDSKEGIEKNELFDFFEKNQNNSYLNELFYEVNNANLSFDLKTVFLKNNISLIKDDLNKQLVFNSFLQQIQKIDEYTLSINIDDLIKITFEIKPIFEYLSSISTLIIFFINRNRSDIAYKLMSKVFVTITKEHELILNKLVYLFIDNISKITNNKSLVEYIDHLFKNIYFIFSYIENEEVKVKIVSDFIEKVTEVSSIYDMKNLIFQVFDFSNKINNLNLKQTLIDLVRKSAPFIKENNHFVDITQKTIILSESIFSQTNIKAKSLLALALINQKYSNKDLSELIIKTVLMEIRSSGYEVYILDIIDFLTSKINNFFDSEKSLEIYKILINSNKNVKSESILSSIYILILSNFFKNQNIKNQNTFIETLFNKIEVFYDESIKTNYIFRFLLLMSTHNYYNDSKNFVNKIFEIIEGFSKEENKILLYKGLFIYLNKFNSSESTEFITKIHDEILELADIYDKADLTSMLFIFTNGLIDKNSNLSTMEINLITESLNLSKKMDDFEKKYLFLTSFLIKTAISKNEVVSKKISYEIIETFNKLNGEEKQLYALKSFIDKLSKIEINDDIKNYIDYIFSSIKFKKVHFICKSYIFISEFCKKVEYKTLYELYKNKLDLELNKLQNLPEKVELLCNLIIEKANYNDIDYINQNFPDIIKTIMIEELSEESLILTIKRVVEKTPDIDIALKNEIKKFINSIDLSKYAYSEFLEYIIFISANLGDLNNTLKGLNFTGNNISKERILNDLIKLFYKKNNGQALINLSFYVINNSIIMDSLISSLLLLINDQEEIINITYALIPRDYKNKM